MYILGLHISSISSCIYREHLQFSTLSTCHLDLTGAEEEEAENASNASSNQDPAALADPFNNQTPSAQNNVVSRITRKWPCPFFSVYRKHMKACSQCLRCFRIPPPFCEANQLEIPLNHHFQCTVGYGWMTEPFQRIFHRALWFPYVSIKLYEGHDACYRTRGLPNALKGMPYKKMLLYEHLFRGNIHLEIRTSIRKQPWRCLSEKSIDHSNELVT